MGHIIEVNEYRYIFVAVSRDSKVGTFGTTDETLAWVVQLLERASKNSPEKSAVIISGDTEADPDLSQTGAAASLNKNTFSGPALIRYIGQARKCVDNFIIQCARKIF